MCENQKEEEEEEETENLTIIYEKGYPLYKLKKREYIPQMNFLKTFDDKKPRTTDFVKDVGKIKWTDQWVDAFLLVLMDVKKFARKNSYSSCQIASLFEIFYSCFQYFFMLPALEKNQFLEYFRETLLHYLVYDPPERLRIFNGVQAFAIAKLFHQMVANNFDMMKYILMPVYQIEIDVVY